MKVIYLKSKRFIRFLLFTAGFYFCLTTVTAGNLTNTPVNVTSDANGDVLFATTFSNGNNSDATSKTSFTLDEIYVAPQKVGSINFSSIYTQSDVATWGTGGTAASPKFAIVSDPSSLKSSYPARTDGKNRLVFHAPNPSTDILTIKTDGNTPNGTVTISFTLEELGGDEEQVDILFGDYSVWTKVSAKGTKTVTLSHAIGSSAVTLKLKTDNWNKPNCVLAISDLKIYGTAHYYVDALNSTVCDGDNITLTAKGFYNQTGDYKWFKSSTATGTFTEITGNATDTLAVQALLGNAYYKVQRADKESEVFELKARVCCKEVENQTVIFKEDFGNIPSGERRDFSQVSSGGEVPNLTYKATGNIDDGNYAIVSYTTDGEDFTSGIGHPWYSKMYDHTQNTDISGNKGGLLFINCGSNTLNKVIYSRELESTNVCTDSYLFFSIYASNPAARGSSAPAKLRLDIVGEDALGNDTILESTYTGNINAADPTWKQYGTSFLPNATYAHIYLQIVSLGDGLIGNDLLLDDISVTVCTPDITTYIENKDTIQKTAANGSQVELESIPLTKLDNIFSGTPYYYWQSSTDTTSTSNWIEAQKGVGLDKITVIANDTIYYRCIVAQNETDAIEAGSGATLTDKCATFSLTRIISIVGDAIISVQIKEKDNKTAICSNGQVTIVATAMGTMASCEWYKSIDNVNWSKIATTDTFVTENLTVDTYYKAVAVDPNGIKSDTSNVVSITVNPIITVALTTNTTRLNLGQSATLNASAENASDVTFAWSNSATLTAATQNVAPYVSSTYYVTGTNACNNVKSNEVTISVVWPTAINPYNQDGLNDIFVAGFNIVVFDRFGHQIFSGNNGWNGKIDSDYAQPGVYYYVVTLPNNDVKKGTVEVVKP